MCIIQAFHKLFRIESSCDCREQGGLLDVLTVLIVMFVVLGARWKEGRPACLDVCMLEGLWVSGDIPAGWDLAHGLHVHADFAL